MLYASEGGIYGRFGYGLAILGVDRPGEATVRRSSAGTSSGGSGSSAGQALPVILGVLDRAPPRTARDGGGRRAAGVALFEYEPGQGGAAVSWCTRPGRGRRVRDLPREARSDPGVPDARAHRPASGCGVAGRVRRPVAVRVRGRPGRSGAGVEPTGGRAVVAPAAGAATPGREAPGDNSVGATGRRRRCAGRPAVRERRARGARGRRPVLPVERGALRPRGDRRGAERHRGGRRSARSHVHRQRDRGDLPRWDVVPPAPSCGSGGTSTPTGRSAAPTRCSDGIRRPGARTPSSP